MEDLYFQDIVKWIKSDKRDSEWTIVYKSLNNESSKENYFAIMLPINKKKDFLKNPTWCLNSTEFGTRFVHYADKKAKYFKWGTDSKYEPIIYQTFYNNLFPTKIELIEEFKLFFNLYFEIKTGEFISISMSSNECIIAKILEDNTILIKTEFLRKFLYAKKCVLGFQLDIYRYTSKELNEISKSPTTLLKENVSDYNYYINFQNSSYFGNPHKKSNSRLLAKCILEGYKQQNIQTRFEEIQKQNKCEFIVDVNLDNGEEILQTCNFIELKEKYDFHTLVFFSRNVLSKYYNNSKRYTVDDGLVSLQGSWRLDIDNNHDDFVAVYLGDLGFLPYEEQLYWKSYNIKPKDFSSIRKYKSQNINIYSNPEIEDLKFKRNYESLNEFWKKYFGFNLYEILDENDSHCFKSIRIPLTNDVGELDTLILNLSKVMVEYLNVKEINKRIKSSDLALPSLEKLKLYIDSIDSERSKEIIPFLKQLQKLRSMGVAHRKSNDYAKFLKSIGLDGKTESFFFKELLRKTNILIENLITIKD